MLTHREVRSAASDEAKNIVGKLVSAQSTRVVRQQSAIESIAIVDFVRQKVEEAIADALKRELDEEGDRES